MVARTRFEATDEWPMGPDERRAEAIEALVAGHTLIVGQSRSGKTNAARRLLEEILLWTEARVLLFDPNGDFRWLNEVDPTCNDAAFKALWAPLSASVTIVTPGGAAPWGIPWGTLSLDEMAAFLNLDPSANFQEYQSLRAHYAFEEVRRRVSGRKDTDLGSITEFEQSTYFSTATGEAVERYRVRLEKLSKRDAWAQSPGEDLDSVLRSERRAVVIDLSMDDEEVRAMMVARALEVIWRQGEEQRTAAMRGGPGNGVPWRGTLVVMDEAHLFAGMGPLDPQRRLVSERIERLADQGKKFNLYLLLVTQQPGKLNPRILAECNNRIILRMNERVSLQLLESMYGGIRGRYNGALTFGTGEALIEGTLLCDEDPPPSQPRGVRFLRACTREGGGSPPMGWAKPTNRPGQRR